MRSNLVHRVDYCSLDVQLHIHGVIWKNRKSVSCILTRYYSYTRIFPTLLFHTSFIASVDSLLHTHSSSAQILASATSIWHFSYFSSGAYSSGHTRYATALKTCALFSTEIVTTTNQRLQFSKSSRTEICKTTADITVK